MKSRYKSAKIEIDQSGRIEETNRDTILAYSDGKAYSIKISSKIKRQILEQFRFIGKPKLFTVRTFSAAIFLLLKDNNIKNHEIIIDIEYPGKHALILDILREYFDKYDRNISDFNFNFKSIGKKSRAHNLAISIFRKKQKPDKVIKYSELKKLAIKKSR